jgi:uncharacterized membrane protein YidH (DUF202 family)
MQQHLCPLHPPKHTHTLMAWIGTALPLSLFKVGIGNETVYHQMVMNNELEVMWKQVARF